ncbi:DUF3472 domain-containing protein [Gimesia panareensis]|uniref:DUF3472 domain-containing protein n=1 Tax=Gimesia panareensis TaxID=2527978 RepID=UPI00118B7D78|nr:hypothetical protein [Gimesia panareensis]QDU51228.1 hypothetical protein Pan110_35920 [Gimesia panareensis]
MLRFRIIQSCCLLMAACLLTESVQADEKEYKQMPWHLVDLWWDLGEESVFESYSIDVTISDDLPSTKNLYIAPIGLGHLSQTPFYGGLQTQSDGYTLANKTLRKIGPGLLMSMWGERSHEAIRPAEGGFFQSSGHEGDFVSIRRPYKWTQGTYTYKLIRLDREMVDGKPCTWVGAFVKSHEKDESIFIGALRFKGDKLMLSPKIASFVEVYGARIPVTEIPRVTVTFNHLQVNGKPATVKSVEAIYPKGVPDYAAAKSTGKSVEIIVGQPVKGRTVRNTRLKLD